jgi:hypothetical protein
MDAMVKEWDLNIFFEEIYNEETGEYDLDKVLTINPVVWSNDNGATDTNYTDMIIKTTFAEARYLRSEYPENEYGYDWTDTLDNFMKVAPVRLRSLLETLPPAHEYRTPRRDYSEDSGTLIR